jgi:hypothetical protein
MHDARSVAAWPRRRVTVARPVRIAFMRIFVFSRVSKQSRKSVKCPNGVPGGGRIAELASVCFGKRRSDVRLDPVFTALSLAKSKSPFDPPYRSA